MNTENEVMAWARDKLKKLLARQSLDTFDAGTVRAVIAALDPETNPLFVNIDITQKPDNTTPAFMERLGVEPPSPLPAGWMEKKYAPMAEKLEVEPFQADPE